MKNKSLLIAAIALLPEVTFASQAYLSDYLGVISGNSTYTGNGSHSIVSAAPYGIGADIAGNWVTPGDAISLNIGGISTEFQKGLGAHPNAKIDFSLGTFRGENLDFDTFHSIVGIDEFSGGEYGSPTNGAVFNVYLDNVLVFTQNIEGVNAGAYAIDVAIGNENQVLSLETVALGIYNSNHAVWADAQLTSVPMPSAIWLFGSALTGIGFVGKNRKNFA